MSLQIAKKSFILLLYTSVLSIYSSKAILAADKTDQEEEINIEEILNSDDDTFGNFADQMSFKRLREIASLNNNAKEKVKKYFDIRRRKLEKLRCPIITKEWLLSHSGKPFKNGRASNDLQRMHASYYAPVAEIEGVKWHIMITKGVRGAHSFLIDEKSELKDGNFAVTEDKGLKITEEAQPTFHVFPEVGPTIFRSCKYNLGNLGYTIELFLGEEFLKLQ